MLNYLAQKITAATVEADPFPHLYIKDFFKPEHFETIISAEDIAIKPAVSDHDLIDALHASDYKEIRFPGTTTDLNVYLEWHREKQTGAHALGDLCEGFGVTVRLQSARSAVIKNLMAFLDSETWLDAISAKFNIDRTQVRYDGGIQKYLDGYEISPHPDIRLKALTYMVNINPCPDSADNEYHTHYMSFNNERAYVGEFWRGNKDLDRCWVPWDWCKTIKIQSDNNSIVIFRPEDDTLHAVRAKYDHLRTQRTQLYGNLWYKSPTTVGKPTWKDLDIRSRLGAA